MAYQTAAQIRAAVPALANAAKYDDTLIDDLVAEFTEIAETYRGVAYQPTTATDESHFIARDVDRLALNRPVVRSITTLTVGDTVVVVSSYFFDARSGIIHMPFVQHSTVTITYEHGFDAPPPLLVRACREYVRSCALSDQSGVPRDVIVQSFGDGGYTRFSTPDLGAGRPTGYLEVDRLLNSLPDYRANCA